MKLQSSGRLFTVGERVRVSHWGEYLDGQSGIVRRVWRNYPWFKNVRVYSVEMTRRDGDKMEYTFWQWQLTQAAALQLGLWEGEAQS